MLQDRSEVAAQLSADSASAAVRSNRIPSPGLTRFTAAKSEEQR